MPQHTSSPINKTPGQSVVLTCTVKSEVKLDIFWYKGEDFPYFPYLTFFIDI